MAEGVPEVPAWLREWRALSEGKRVRHVPKREPTPGRKYQLKYQKQRYERGVCTQAGCKNVLDVNPASGKKYMYCKECRERRRVYDMNRSHKKKETAA